jgi:nitrogen fixation protein FixH
MMSSPTQIRPARGESGSRTITGRHVLLAMLAFFLVTTGVNGVMIYVAVTTFGGVETADAYRRGLAYNRRLAAEDAQMALGWRHELALSPSKRDIVFRLSDRDGRPVAGLAVTATLERPATDRFDTSLVLAETSAGVYGAPLAGLDPGAWVVAVAASRAGEQRTIYAARRRLWLAR